MNSRLLKLKWKDQNQICDLLKQGKTCLVETETVVGLMGNPDTESTINAIKKSPDTKPLSLFVGEWSQVESIWSVLPEGAEQLNRAFWPGSLTLIAGEPIKKGIRMPKIDPLLELLKLSGPCVCTSANFSGAEAPSTLEGVDPDLIDRVDFIIDEKASESSGLASTILIHNDQDWQAIRTGSIDEETWKKALQS